MDLYPFFHKLAGPSLDHRVKKNWCIEQSQGIHDYGDSLNGQIEDVHQWDMHVPSLFYGSLTLAEYSLALELETSAACSSALAGSVIGLSSMAL